MKVKTILISNIIIVILVSSISVVTAEESQLPVAVAGGPYNGYRGEPVILNASESYDSDGSIVNYTWIFGDDTVGYGKITTHNFPYEGEYTVSLIVTDNDGDTNENITTVRIRHPSEKPPPASPISMIKKLDNAYINDKIFFDGSWSYDPDGTIISYNWSFGDGTFGTGEIIIHNYTIVGEYTITLTVTDNDGLNNTNITTIVIKNNGTSENKNDGKEDKGIPGFELVFVMVAVALVLFWQRKRI